MVVLPKKPGLAAVDACVCPNRLVVCGDVVLVVAVPLPPNNSGLLAVVCVPEPPNRFEPKPVLVVVAPDEKRPEPVVLPNAFVCGAFLLAR